MGVYHNLPGDRQPQSGASTDYLGGKQMFKHLVGNLLRNARAVIGNGDLNLLAYRCGANLDAVGTGLHLRLAAILAGLIKGINGVGQNVHKYLVELTGEAVNFGNTAVVCRHFNFGSLVVGLPPVAQNQQRTLNAGL